MNAPPIRVMHILEATTGGTARWLENVMLGLDEQRIEQSCICSSSRSPEFERVLNLFRKRGLKVWVINMSRSINPVQDFRALQKITQILRDSPVDVLHAHSAKGGMLGRIAARMAQVPVSIYSPHAYPFLGAGLSKPIYYLLERIATTFTDYVMAVSNEETKLAIQMGIPPEKVYTVYNAVSVPPKASSEQEEPSSFFTIGTAAAMRSQKDPLTFIDAAALALKKIPNLQFIYCGTGQLERQVEQRIRFHHMEEKIKTKGEIHDVLESMRSWNIFVLSSTYEGLPYSVLEAMSLGLPVVATDVQGTRELVVHDETGLLIPPGDTQALADAIVELAMSPDKAAKMGEMGRKRISSFFNTDEQFAKLYDMYEEVKQLGYRS